MENAKYQGYALNDYNWLVQNVNKLKLGKYTDIGAFTYMNAKYGININDYVQIGSHCSLYTISTIDNKRTYKIRRKFKNRFAFHCNAKCINWR